MPTNTYLLLLRELIDNVDAALVSTLLNRMRVLGFILQYKTIHQLPATRSEIRQEAIDKVFSFASNLGLSLEFVEKFFDCIYQQSQTLIQFNPQEQWQDFFKSSEAMLSELNSSLASLDMALCCLLAERMQLVARVGRYKKKHQIKPLAAARWQAVLKSKQALATSLGIEPQAITQIFNLIHEEALVIEARIIASTTD